MELDEKKRKRFEFLHALYDMVQGDTVGNAQAQAIAEAIGVNFDNEASQIGRYLKNEGMVDFSDFNKRQGSVIFVIERNGTDGLMKQP